MHTLIYFSRVSNKYNLCEQLSPTYVAYLKVVQMFMFQDEEDAYDNFGPVYTYFPE